MENNTAVYMVVVVVKIPNKGGDQDYTFKGIPAHKVAAIQADIKAPLQKWIEVHDGYNLFYIDKGEIESVQFIRENPPSDPDDESDDN